VAGKEEELAAAFGNAEGEPENEAVLELLRRGIGQVQQLDPAGVGARDLRECLLIQIAAQQREFALLFARHSAEPGETEENPHRSFRAEAEAQLEERRRSM
jgi:RNA polymerase sigma-54 factor